MKGRTIVRMDPTITYTNSTLEAIHADAMDRRYGAGEWASDESWMSRLNEIWHILIHPLGIHWKMQIEEIDLREGVVSRSLGVRCALCEVTY